jgi:predicted nucleotidyltransferase
MIRRLANGKLEIIVDADQPFEEWLDALPKHIQVAQNTLMDTNNSGTLPTREELNAELLEIPEPREQPEAINEPAYEDVVAGALRHVRGRRGGDLVSVILVGSGARRAVTAHSDVDLIALVKGQAEGHEIVRVADRLADIRYRGHKEVEDELAYSARLPPLLRKGRILYDHDGIGAKLIERANTRFRQGPPPTSMNEQIRMKAGCLHWLGKAQDVADQPATANYMLMLFFDDFVHAFFLLRGLWLTAPVDVPRFMTSRDPILGDLAARFLSASTLAERLNCARDLVPLLFKDVPNPARID